MRSQSIVLIRSLSILPEFTPTLVADTKKLGTICFCIRKIKGYDSVFQKQNRYQKIEAPRQAVWRISCVTSGKSLYPSEPVSQVRSLPSLIVTLRMFPTMISFPNCLLGISCFPPKGYSFSPPSTTCWWKQWLTIEGNDLLYHLKNLRQNNLECPLHRWGPWGTERLGNLSRVRH